MLSDSPPERDVIWTEEGVQGAARFVQRVWRIVGEVAERAPASESAAYGPEATALRRAAHKALSALETDLERLAFNRCVAHLYALANSMGRALEVGPDSEGMDAALREAAGILVQALAPMMPHLGEECWAALGRSGLVAEAPWPAADPALVADDEIILPVQVNGRKRAEVTVSSDADNATVEASVRSLDAVQRALEGRPIRKVIVVPRRIVNVVG